MEKYRFESYSENDIIEKALPITDMRKFILLAGDLGAGKTTLVKNLLKKKGITETVTSPTFSIHNSYGNILHSDLYRIKSMVELEQTGFFELIENAGKVFIEWADLFNLKDVLERYVEIRIIKTGENDRVYEFTVV